MHHHLDHHHPTSVNPTSGAVRLSQPDFGGFLFPLFVNPTSGAIHHCQPDFGGLAVTTTLTSSQPQPSRPPISRPVIGIHLNHHHLNPHRLLNVHTSYFMVSGAKVLEGCGKYVVIAVGQKSFNGRIMMGMLRCNFLPLTPHAEHAAYF